MISEFLLYAASLLGPVSILSCKILLEMSLFISWSIMRWKLFICLVEESWNGDLSWNQKNDIISSSWWLEQLQWSRSELKLFIFTSLWFSMDNNLSSWREKRSSYFSIVSTFLVNVDKDYLFKWLWSCYYLLLCLLVRN